jgi:steroid delta-isomerase-like uncharacterized protein
MRGMERQEATAFFARLQKAWDLRDSEALAFGHTEDGTIVSPIFRTVQGREAIATSYVSLFTIFPDWKYTGEGLLVDGDQVAEMFSVTATHAGEFMGFPGTGRKCEIRGVRMFTIRDGLIAHERRFYDFTGLLIQIGVLKSKPANL